MTDSWNPITLTTEADTLHVLSELRGRRWLFRGQPRRYAGLVPSIDRGPLQLLSREAKLRLERRSIELFRSTARFFADPGEERALADDIVAMMVLRHYGVPSRILDWSSSPWIAAYFACEDHDTKDQDGELWTFDEPLYEQEGAKQWKRWPQTTSDGSGDPAKFVAGLTAFLPDEPPDWFICGFYPLGFYRQNAQQSVYTMTARFGCDHAEAIGGLFANPAAYYLYVIAAALKPKLRELL